MPVATYTGSPQEILDDEDRHGMVSRNYQRTLRASFDVNSMVPLLAIKAKSVLFEHTDEALVVNGTDGGR